MHIKVVKTSIIRSEVKQDEAYYRQSEFYALVIVHYFEW